MPVMLDAVVDHYVEQELPILRYGTQQSHLCTLNRWILPRWGRYLLEQVKPVHVEEWLRSLPWHPRARPIFGACFTLSMCTPGAGIDGQQSDWSGASVCGRKTIRAPLVLGNRSALHNLWAVSHDGSRAACLGCALVRSSGSSGRLQLGTSRFGENVAWSMSGRRYENRGFAASTPRRPHLARILEQHWEAKLAPMSADWYSEIGMAGHGGRRVPPPSIEARSAACRVGEDWLCTLSDIPIQPC